MLSTVSTAMNNDYSQLHHLGMQPATQPPTLSGMGNEYWPRGSGSALLPYINGFRQGNDNPT